MLSVELRCVHLILMTGKGMEPIYAKKYISLFHIKIIMNLKVYVIQTKYQVYLF